MVERGRRIKVLEGGSGNYTSSPFSSQTQLVYLVTNTSRRDFTPDHGRSTTGEKSRVPKDWVGDRD